MELKMMFYLINVASVVDISQPSVIIGGGLHALIRILGVIHMPGIAYEIGVFMYRRLAAAK